MNETLILTMAARPAVSLLPIHSLLPHEEHDPQHAGEVASQLKENGLWRTPLLVERQHLIILDGHHRFEAAKRLGLTHVPAMLIAYGDPRLSLSSWRAGEKWMAQDIISRALSGRLCPIKTTRHKMHPPIEKIAIPLAHLRLAEDHGKLAVLR